MEAITTRRFEGLASARVEIFSRSSAGSIEVVRTSSEKMRECSMTAMKAWLTPTDRTPYASWNSRA